MMMAVMWTSRIIHYCGGLFNVMVSRTVLTTSVNVWSTITTQSLFTGELTKKKIR